MKHFRKNSSFSLPGPISAPFWIAFGTIFGTERSKMRSGRRSEKTTKFCIRFFVFLVNFGLPFGPLLAPQIVKNPPPDNQASQKGLAGCPEGASGPSMRPKPRFLMTVVGIVRTGSKKVMTFMALEDGRCSELQFWLLFTEKSCQN